MKSEVVKKGVNVFIDIIITVSGKMFFSLFFLLGWPFVDGVGRITAHLFVFLKPGKRKVATLRIAQMLGDTVTEDQVREMVTASFLLYYKRQAESVFLGAMDREKIEARVQASGLHHIDTALARGRGVILLLSHFGSFLFPPLFLGHRGYKVNQVAGRQMNRTRFQERVWLWRKSGMDNQPVRFIQAEKFLRPLYSALKNNEIVTIAFDGRDSRTWVEVDFFGSRANFSPGPFELARRTGAAIVPAFTLKREDHTHCIEFLPRFALAAEDNQERSAEIDTQNFAKLFENYIRRYPSHFGMIPVVVEARARNSGQRMLFEESGI